MPTLGPVTYTSHANWRNCPRKFWHVNVAKDLPRAEPTTAMRWGIEVHAAMERRLNEGVPLPPAMAVLTALRAEAEGETYEDTTLGQPRLCRDVYLDNAHARVTTVYGERISRRSFAARLSVLERAGLYRSHGDNAFGLVIMEN
jgi:hypothetical protein